MKLLVFLIIVGAIWYGARWFRQVDAIRRAHLTDAPRPASTGRVRPLPRATDTVLCSVCNAYVPTDMAGPCGRRGCPFPRRA
jgi:uncharacterized protein